MEKVPEILQETPENGEESLSLMDLSTEVSFSFWFLSSPQNSCIRVNYKKSHDLKKGLLPCSFLQVFVKTTFKEK